MSRILFSPIGGTDPIPEKGYYEEGNPSEPYFYEGSMLHIMRTYRPDKAILFLSKEVYEKEEKDHRYTESIELLKADIKLNCAVSCVDRKELSDVQKFDYFYDDFGKILSAVSDEMTEEDELILNISSGTPAMKSALIVWATLLNKNCICVQVTTPAKKMNEHFHSGEYDIRYYWERNKDNAENYINRCSEETCPSLLRIKNEEIIKRLVNSYDYSAAVEVANTMQPSQTGAYIWLLKLADMRTRLELSNIDNTIRNRKIEDFDILPFKKGDKMREIFEYALFVDLKLKKKEYADFIRSLSPVFVELFRLILKNRMMIDIEDYICIKNNGQRKWDESKLKKKGGSKYDEQLRKQYGAEFKYGTIVADHLKILICENSDDKELCNCVETLRKVESKVRNLAAHEIVSINEKLIKDKAGVSPTRIVELIKKCFEYIGVDVEKEWNSYEKMNQRIIEVIERV